LTPAAHEAIDGQQLCRSAKNGNYYLRVNGSTEPIMLGARDAFGWFMLRRMAVPADLAYWATKIEEQPADWMHHAMTCATRQIGKPVSRCDCGAVTHGE
jgi:hypothetical protein